MNAAKASPDTLCIGIDASRDGLIEASQKARRSPKKGGAPNAYFVLSSIEALPEDFCNVADTITINYPWGSLLAAMTTPDTSILTKIALMAKADAEIRIVLNWSVFENESYCERLGLHKLSLAEVAARLAQKYHEAGLTIVKHGLEGTGPTTTTWGKKLVKGSNRAVLSIACRLN